MAFEEKLMAVIAILFVSLLLLLILVASLRTYMSEKKQNKNNKEEIFTDDEPEFKVVGAVVLSKHSVMHTTRYEHSVKFRVTFMTDDGEKVEINVPQEIYDEVYESQSGDLVTVNGNFFDFGHGEPIE